MRARPPRRHPARTAPANAEAARLVPKQRRNARHFSKKPASPPKTGTAPALTPKARGRSGASKRVSRRPVRNPAEKNESAPPAARKSEGISRPARSIARQRCIRDTTSTRLTEPPPPPLSALTRPLLRAEEEKILPGSPGRGDAPARIAYKGREALRARPRGGGNAAPRETKERPRVPFPGFPAGKFFFLPKKFLWTFSFGCNTLFRESAQDDGRNMKRRTETTSERNGKRRSGNPPSGEALP